MNKALIVIDVQEDFTRGALRNQEAINALPVISEIVDYARNNFDNPITYTMDTHDMDYLQTQEGKCLPVEHCIYLTPGWEICPEVKPPEEEKRSCNYILKFSFGASRWAEEQYNWLSFVDEIVMCGFCTDICVSANFQIIKALFPEVPITIISDACAGVTPELHKAALDVMKSCQANIMTWSEYKK